MKALITGARGQLGKELLLQCRNRSWDVSEFGSEDLDITNLNRVIELITNLQPELVINCAAFTKVDLCESEIEQAFRVNALGPRNLAVACEETRTELIHISTDYVFDGGQSSPRREYDVTGPNTVYGSSKLLGEEMVRSLCRKHYLIRTAWLYGDGKNFVNTMLDQAKQGKELRVANDQIGSPTSTRELARVIIKLAGSDRYGLYHGTCQGECSWYDFACKIFEIMGWNIRVIPVSSKEFHRAATRPAYSVLDNFLLRIQGMDSFSHWEDALADFLITAQKELISDE